MINDLSRRLHNGIMGLLEGVPGEIGKLQENGSYLVRVENTLDEVYVRLNGDPLNTVAAINHKTAWKARLPVRLHMNASGRWEVDKADPLPALAFLGEAVGTGNMPPLVGEAVNVVWSGEQLKPGRVRAENGLDLLIRMEELPYPEILLGGPDTITDLTDAVAAIGSGKKAWVVISVDPGDNTITATNGTDVDPADVLTWADACAIAVPSGDIPLAAYVLSDGITTLPIRPIEQDQYFYVDLRPWITLGGAGGGGGVESVSSGTGITVDNTDPDNPIIDLDIPVAIANGGTGETAKEEGFNALAPTNTKGDLIAHDGSDNIVLPVGTNGDLLTVDSAEPTGLKYVAASSIVGLNQLTGDVTAGPGSGSQAATLATVNSDVGTFSNPTMTVNGKGLVTAIDDGPALAWQLVAGEVTLVDSDDLVGIGGDPESVLDVRGQDGARAFSVRAPATPTEPLVQFLENDGATPILTIDDEGTTFVEKQFVPPRLTEVERDAIATPVDGSLLYNTDTDKLNVRENGEWVDNSPKFAVLQHQETQNTNAGNFVATTWTTRVLNTEVVDAKSIVAISSNQFTPIAGTYFIEVEAAISNGAGIGIRHRLRNITAGSTPSGGIGINDRLNSTGRAHMKLCFTANGTDAYAIQYYSTAGVTNGLGLAINETGQVEIYVSIFLEKIA